MAHKLIVPIIGDSSSYERALKRSESATQQFGRALGTTSPKLGKLSQASQLAGSSTFFFAGAAAGLATAIGAKSINAASDLNEQISRTQVVLGKSSDEMIKWSETTAESMGISQRAALAAAGTFAGLFQTVGVARPQAAELSRSLVQLAADLASLQNSSPEEALIALRSGLAGEAEPLRRFNIFLTEARVQQQALAETGKKTTSALTQQEKTLARYSLIMQDSVLAQGNFALTSGGLANQQRKLAAQVDDLSTKLGSVLVPGVTAVVGALNDAITAGEDLAGVLGTLASLPAIEIPVKLVSDVAGGRGGFILRHIVLGGISPLALGITIGKEVVDGIRSAMADAPPPATMLLGGDEGVKGQPIGVSRDAAAAQAKANTKAGQAVIDSITRAATAQRSFTQQIADSEKRATHLRDLIRVDPDNAKLQQRLTAELKLQSSLREQSAAAAKASAAEARSAAEAAKAEAEAVATARREREKMAAQARQAAVKANQFKAIGLTAGGLQPTPGTESLLGRALSLEDQIKGTVLDKGKTGKQLRQIINFLKTHLKTAKQEVRAAILDMLNGISDALDGKDSGAKKGPLTSTHGLATAQIIKNLGLTVEQAEEIQRRLTHATTSGGRTLSSAAGRGVATLPRQGVGAMPVVVESHTTINLDGQQIANVVTRNQQKDRRRNPRQKRGPHRN